jgi:hypothetical protein
MIARRLTVCLSIVFCAALAGCGSGPAKPAPKGAPAIMLTPANQARKDMLGLAKKIEDPAGFEALETYVKNSEHEDPAKRWKWEDLDQHILNGTYSIQTKMAYEKWRTAKLIEGAKR